MPKTTGAGKSSSGAGSKKHHRLSKQPNALLCKGTREKPLNGDYACRQLLGMVGEGGISIKCRRCKTITEFTWQELNRLREIMQKGK
jgi:LSD1 subclass zinc finger protein